MEWIVLIFAVLFLSYTNGANDNFKGVATLFGSDTITFKQAIYWGTGTTFLGSLTSVILASHLISYFAGKGLVPVGLTLETSFVISLALGAAITVFLATRIGMPISTTHALIGGLFGTGWMAVGLAEIQLGLIVKLFVLPLLLSPLVAMVLSLLSYRGFRFLRVRSGIQKTSCVCVEDSPKIQSIQMMTATLSKEIKISTCDTAQVSDKYTGNLLGISAAGLLNISHIFSAGVVSFSRGLNDTPKIVALLLLVPSVNVQYSMLIVAIFMAVGGLIQAKKVGILMSKKITQMNEGQGFTANLITGSLVMVASIFGLPVSTTHVSVGSIFGIGTVTGTAQTSNIRKILLSWVLTLPLAAVIGGGIYYLMGVI